MNHPLGSENLPAHPAATPANNKHSAAFSVMSAPALPIARAITHHLLARPEPAISFKTMTKLPSAPKPATSAPMPAPPIGNQEPAIPPALSELKSPHRYHVIKTPLAPPAINQPFAQPLPVLPPQPAPIKLLPLPPPSATLALMLVQPTGLPEP